MISAAGLEMVQNKGYAVLTLFNSDSSIWRELQTSDSFNQSPSFDSNEVKGAHVVVAAL